MSTFEQSFGIIPVYRHKDDIQLLLIKHLAGHWGFPKGHAEEGEGEFAAACREFEEETGIFDFSASPQPSFSEHYICIKNGCSVSKTVRYFIGIVRSKELTLQAAEIQDAQWLPPAHANDYLNFDASRTMLAEAMPTILLTGE